MMMQSVRKGQSKERWGELLRGTRNPVVRWDELESETGQNPWERRGGRLYSHQVILYLFGERVK